MGVRAAERITVLGMLSLFPWGLGRAFNPRGTCMLAPVNVEATTDGPLATGADTLAVGVFEGEDVAHDLPGGGLSALLESGEARREFKRLAVTHAEGKRVIL